MERRRRDVLAPLLPIVAVIVVLAFFVFRPFLIGFAVAGSVAILLAPVHRRLERGMGGRTGLAAALLVLVSTVAILLPVLTALFILGNQAVAFFDWLTPQLEPAELERLFRETLPARFPRLWALVSVHRTDSRASWAAACLSSRGAPARSSRGW